MDLRLSDVRWRGRGQAAVCVGESDELRRICPDRLHLSQRHREILAANKRGVAGRDTGGIRASGEATGFAANGAVVAAIGWNKELQWSAMASSLANDARPQGTIRSSFGATEVRSIKEHSFTARRSMGCQNPGIGERASNQGRAGS